MCSEKTTSGGAWCWAEKVLFRSSKSVFSRHDHVQASSTLFIWLNENVGLVSKRAWHSSCSRGSRFLGFLVILGVLAF